MITPTHNIKQLPKWAQAYIDLLILEIEALQYDLNQKDAACPEPTTWS
jgi:hypothetical protein